MAKAESAPDSQVDSELGRALADFLAHARDELGLSPATINAYRRDLQGFASWCHTQALTKLESIDNTAIRSFAASEHRRGLNPRSIQRCLSALRRLYAFLRREGLVQQDPAAAVRAPRYRPPLPRPLEVDQILALLNIPEESEIAVRDRAMLELCYASGLRVSELAGLSWDRLDAREGLVRVLGKGSKERLVPVGRHALAALANWRRVQAEQAAGAERIFTTVQGKPLGVRAIQKRVAYWSERQGLDQRVHPHQLRHSFASHILESSGDLRAVQELLGHANLSTTQIYTHLDFQHLAKVYDQTHPRAKKRKKGD